MRRRRRRRRRSSNQPDVRSTTRGRSTIKWSGPEEEEEEEEEKRKKGRGSWRECPGDQKSDSEFITAVRTRESERE